MGPQLQVRLTWQQGQWRHRLAVAQQYASSVTGSVPSLQPAVLAIASQANAQHEALAPMQGHYDEAAAALAAANERVAGAQERLQALSEELAAVEADLERTHQAVDGKGSELSSTEPLHSVRGSLRLLTAEARHLSLRESVLQQAVTNRKRGLRSAPGRHAY